MAGFSFIIHFIGLRFIFLGYRCINEYQPLIPGAVTGKSLQTRIRKENYRTQKFRYLQ